MGTLSPLSRSVLAVICSGAVLFSVVVIGSQGTKLDTNRIVAAACSSGFFGFLTTCTQSDTSGNGCRTTTQCKKKWWGFGGSKCSTTTICPVPVASAANVSSAPGSGLSCPAASPNLCGGTSCIPNGAACCASVGFPDRFCTGATFCTTSGQCEATSGGQNCSANYNQPCQASTNSCGMSNSGFNSCTGFCQAVMPADSSCPVPNITLTKSPLLFVNSGDTCTLTWTTTNTTSCALVNLNTGATAASGKNGTYATPPMTSQIDFRLNCQNGTVVSSSASISCLLNPAFEEH